MLEQKDIIVGDQTVRIQQLGTSLALKHSIIIGKLIGGAAIGIDSVGKRSVQDWDIDFGKMIDGVLANLDSEESPKWIQLLVSQSVIVPQYTTTWFDKTFSANLEGLMELIKEICEYNYGGLIEYVGKKIEVMNTLTESSEEPEKKTQAS